MSTAFATRTPIRQLHVAVELAGSGHHPAAATLAGTRPVIGPDYWIDQTVPVDAGERLDLSAYPRHVVRIQAADLRDAQRERDRVRAELIAQERDPDEVTVLVDLEVLVAADARTARHELARLDSALDAPKTPSSLRYVGTPLGLAGLIADITAAGVADGVTLLPLTQPGVLEQVIDTTLPWLEGRGVTTTSNAVDQALRSFGLAPRVRTLAS
ncbi:MAG: hypothetical protein GX542_03005 [Rhodococcus sp.]|nr:hypothetical protein [Rhodococcus sp. (in: high G+C Gram-positive bacteria)]